MPEPPGVSSIISCHSLLGTDTWIFVTGGGTTDGYSPGNGAAVTI